MRTRKVVSPGRDATGQRAVVAIDDDAVRGGQAEAGAHILGRDRFVDQATMRACIEAQRCPWCDRQGLRSLANHTIVAHQVYADELRELAGFDRDAPLCSPELSECHRELAREQDTHEWLQQPAVLAATAATREANYDDEQRKRWIEHFNAVREDAIEAVRRRLEAEKQDPELAAARRIARSRARRAFRPGVECPTCGVWFCSSVAVGKDYRQCKYCSDTCHREGKRRLRARTWACRQLVTLLRSEGDVR